MILLEPMSPLVDTISTISFENGTQETNINFSILSPLHEERPPCDNNDTIEVTGDATITETYTGGEIAVILMEPGNVGPIHHSIVQPEIFGVVQRRRI